jgi:hypothetical protein
MCLAAALSVAAAHETTDFQPSYSNFSQTTPVQANPDLPSGWFDRLWQAPLAWFLPEPLELTLFTPPAPEQPPCLVEPLSIIEDEEAAAFEAQVDSGSVVNLEGLTSGASRGLTRLQRIVESAGGSLLLTSAYRPAAYQAHLQAVWDKWMTELRHDVAPECETLRAEVGYEFTRHGLLETQRPASFSDHTRGIGVDAAVILPRRARLGRVRVGIDRLARMAGFRRPDAGRDPVHFRFVSHL